MAQKQGRVPLENWSNFWQNIHQKEHIIVDLADKNDFKELAKQLEEEGFPYNINSANALNNWNAMHFAVFNDNLDMVSLLRKYGGKIDINTGCGQSLMHIAVRGKSLKMCQKLSEYKAPINLQDNDLNTPLHIACELNQFEIVKFLLQNGADYRIKNNKLQEPVHVSQDPEILRLFEQKGVDLCSPRKRPKVNDKLVLSSALDVKLKYIHNVLSLKMGRDIKVNNLKFVKKLGQGAFGEVFQVFDEEHHCFYALKSLSLEVLNKNRAIKYARVERKILKKVKSQYVVKLKGSFQNRTHIFLLEEYISGSDLDSYKKKKQVIDEKEVANIALQILTGLKDLHDLGYIYRDLKPLNVMIQPNGQIKLVDFGLSKHLDEELTYSFCGSIAYMAPEMITRTGHDHSLDYYLLGVLIYELLQGVPPFYDRTRQQIYQNVLYKKLRFPKPVSEAAKSLIKEVQKQNIQLLERDPRLRPTIHEIKLSSFFNGVDLTHRSPMSFEGPTQTIQNPFDFSLRPFQMIEKWDWNISYE